MRVNTITGLSVLGSRPVVTLSAADQLLYSSLLGLNGTVTIDYTILMGSNPWVAGIYSTPLTFYSLTPVSQQLTITVPGFITNPTPVPVFTFNINTLAAFASDQTISQTFSYSTTVPITLRVGSAGTTFAFNNNGFATNYVPSVAVQTLRTAIDDPLAVPQFQLTTTNSALSSPDLPVPSTNKQNITAKFFISSADLQTKFVQAGTYTSPNITYTANKATSAYPSTLTSGTLTSSVQVVVAKMSALTIRSDATVVPLNFNSAATYKNGVSATVADQLNISSTTPYNLTVKANGTGFTRSGSTTIVPGVLNIGISGGSTVTLSTTPQTLISGADPVINRKLSMIYTIPASQTQNLLNRTGTFTGTITYTLTAP